MKVIILAGGKGTRISEYTRSIPKPMINIARKPIISHIINIFSSYKFDEIIIAAGYKKKLLVITISILKMLKLLIQEVKQ